MSVLAAALLTIVTGFGIVVLSAPLSAYLYDPLFTVYLSIVLSTLLLGALIAFTGVRHAMHGGLAMCLCLRSLEGVPLGSRRV